MLMFGSFSAWRSHEMHHRREWCCPLCDFLCHEEEKARTHLIRQHHELTKHHEIDMLLQTISRLPEHLQADDCPFCDWGTILQERNTTSGEHDLAVPSRRFMRHVGKHLEEIALFVVPQPEEDETSSDDIGSNAVHAARNEDSATMSTLSSFKTERQSLLSTEPRQGETWSSNDADEGLSSYPELPSAIPRDHESSATDDEEPDPDDPLEPKYCYCLRGAYGDMVGCDNPKCEREWFHLGCTDLDNLPPDEERWFCTICRPRDKLHSFGNDSLPVNAHPESRNGYPSSPTTAALPLLSIKPDYRNPPLSGPLSPSMLTSPTSHNISSDQRQFSGSLSVPSGLPPLRTGLTPIPSGSIYQKPLSNSQAPYNARQSLAPFKPSSPSINSPKAERLPPIRHLTDSLTELAEAARQEIPGQRQDYSHHQASVAEAPKRSNLLSILDNEQPIHASMVAESLARIPRPARPSYNEEQKFFIMYYRVIKELSWPEIEDKFATFFNLRIEHGLTSVYYRTRQNWGMDGVLKTGLDGSMGDRGRVESKAAHFSREFLTKLGYFD
jgi:hypothetical protein